MKKHERPVLKREKDVIVYEQIDAQNPSKEEEEYNNIQLVRHAKNLEVVRGLFIEFILKERARQEQVTSFNHKVVIVQDSFASKEFVSN